jgi:hypothetical protein
MKLLATLISLLVPGISISLLEKGIKAAQIIGTAFAGDEVRREAETAGMIEELRAGQTPTIITKVLT